MADSYRPPPPHSVGLCPWPDHTGEFHMPDAAPGDVCPLAGCGVPLRIYTLDTVSDPCRTAGWDGPG